MPKAIKFKHTFYESGHPKYEEGKTYPATEETLRQAALGHAEEVNAKADEVTPIPEEKNSDKVVEADAKKA
jgi:hypothetical protein